MHANEKVFQLQRIELRVPREELEENYGNFFHLIRCYESLIIIQKTLLMDYVKPRATTRFKTNVPFTEECNM